MIIWIGGSFMGHPVIAHSCKQRNDPLSAAAVGVTAMCPNAWKQVNEVGSHRWLTSLRITNGCYARPTGPSLASQLDAAANDAQQIWLPIWRPSFLGAIGLAVGDIIILLLWLDVVGVEYLIHVWARPDMSPVTLRSVYIALKGRAQCTLRADTRLSARTICEWPTL